MLHYVMCEHCKPTVWTHLPLASLQRTAFHPDFWEKPGWKKTDIMELLYHRVGIVSPCELVVRMWCVMRVKCAYQTCVRFMAVWWEMVPFCSVFRTLSTGLDNISWKTCSCSCCLLVAGTFPAVALWGDSTSGIRWSLLSGVRFRARLTVQRTQDV